MNCQWRCSEYHNIENVSKIRRNTKICKIKCTAYEMVVSSLQCQDLIILRIQSKLNCMRGD